MKEFGGKLKKYLREAGYSLEAISGALGIARPVLSAKLSGTRKALTYGEIKLVVKTLASLDAINTQAQALELLTLTHCPNFTESEWQQPPLNKLEKAVTPSAKPAVALAPLPLQMPLVPFTQKEAEVLVQVKMYKPQLRARLVHRPHLLDRLANLQQYKLSLVVAPAGFGKTTLAAVALYNNPAESVWVSLYQSDNANRFWRYVLASLSHFLSELDLDYLYNNNISWDQFLPAVLNQLTTNMTQDYILVLDDYHLVNNDEAVTKGMTYLLDHLPPQLHLMLVSRTLPLLPLSRYKVANQLIELTAADMRFTLEESSQFLNEVMDLELANKDIEMLENRTEGWVAGLQLAALSLQSRRGHTTKFISQLKTNSEFVAEYLFEEVFALQPPQIQTFLLQTALVGELHAGLCAALTNRPDSPAILAQLEKSNLFISRLGEDNQWYHYHNLFADFLNMQAQRNFKPAELAELHKAASIWYEEHSYIVETVNHAVLFNDDYAVLLLERIIPIFSSKGIDLLLPELVEKISRQP